MSTGSGVSFVSRIQSAIDTLHPTERRLAEVFLNLPGQVSSYSATELAQIAGVSNASVTRFVRKIGYGSFDEARQSIRAEQSDGAALFRVGRDGDAIENGLDRHFEQSRLNLEQTLSGLSEATTDALVERMIAAPRLWLLGYRAGQPFARYLGWQVLQVRSGVTVLPRDGETMAESLAAIGRDDCVILFAMRRPPRILSQIATQLGRTGAAVAVIGDLAGLHELPGRWHFPCRTTSSGPLFNHVGVMALCGLLGSRVVEQIGPEGRQRLTRIAGLHDSLGEL